MTNGILDTRREDELRTQPAQRRLRGPWALSIAAAALSLYCLTGFWSSSSGARSQQRAVADLSQRMAVLDETNSSLSSALADAKTDLDAARERLVAAGAAAERARALAVQNRSQAERTRSEFSDAVERERTTLGDVRGSVDAVRSDVASNGERIERARADLWEHGGWIKKNREDLDALKRSSQRERFALDIRESDRFERFGPLTLRLDDTNVKRQRYNVTVVVDDKRVEKKDNALLEPVMFYVPGTQTVLELVASEIRDGRIVGHVSSPRKEVSE